jgi:sulfite dehydrogenase (cytochrome) subunit A
MPARLRRDARCKPLAEFLRRRRLLSAAGVAALGLPHWAMAAEEVPASAPLALADGQRPLIAYPQKRPLLAVSTRPPHLETPFAVFDEGVLTPNDAFFVRYHLADIPLAIDTASFRLTVGGHVERALSLSLDELHGLASGSEVVAVNQCSGNSRGYSEPRVFGAQLSNGSMGNARWAGVPLRTVLARAGVKAGAQVVVFDGLDRPVVPATPDFRKSLGIDHALSSEPLIAWQMNGEPLPMLNGFPLRLVVPGWFGTYWMKHLASIEVLDHAFEGHDAFFMTKGYRVPDNDCTCVAPGTAPAATRPISTLALRSFITNVHPGQVFPRDQPARLRGIAFDRGSGIRAVEVSSDGGTRWQAAELAEELGPWSFRAWQLLVRFERAGPARLMVRATSKSGESQPTEAGWNPGGYRRNVIESVSVEVA